MTSLAFLMRLIIALFMAVGVRAIYELSGGSDGLPWFVAFTGGAIVHASIASVLVRV